MSVKISDSLANRKCPASLLSKHFHGVILSKIDYRQQKKRQFFLILRALMKFERRRQIIRNEERLQPRYHGYDTVCCFVKFHPRLSRIIQLMNLARSRLRKFWTCDRFTHLNLLIVNFAFNSTQNWEMAALPCVQIPSIILRYFVSSYGRKRSRPKMAD